MGGDEAAIHLAGLAPAVMAVATAFGSWPNVTFIFAHSERVSEEVTLPDGKVEKKTIFVHKGWFRLTGDFSEYTP